ncbi:hypothetical protein [Dechloromonas sp.]|uniref:hypothetical protein n=1 Tax=Dechloromonas sp. TaxID=1917218 RepID=UPI001205C2D3|nr:hypothetical protein [Dechloromonas sp.]MBU3696442.1 hypothetical protein [Dechloromonas sp.]TEX46961.1 MAG: hypothetical protein CFR70_10065 [Rhodocyclaceae bacterium]
MLEISSQQPLNEPVLTLLVTIGYEARLQREYTVLPDFPVDRSNTATAAADRIEERAWLAPSSPPVARRKARPAPAAAGDRLVLSAAPVDLPATAHGATDALLAMTERMLRLETELRHLGNNLAALDEAIRLCEQKAAVRNELKIAESLQSATLAVTTPATDTVRKDILSPLLQTMGCALLGGLISVGLLQLANRRRQSKLPRA